MNNLFNKKKAPSKEKLRGRTFLNNVQSMLGTATAPGGETGPDEMQRITSREAGGSSDADAIRLRKAVDDLELAQIAGTHVEEMGTRAEPADGHFRSSATASATKAAPPEAKERRGRLGRLPYSQTFTGGKGNTIGSSDTQNKGIRPLRELAATRSKLLNPQGQAAQSTQKDSEFVRKPSAGENKIMRAGSSALAGEVLPLSAIKDHQRSPLQQSTLQQSPLQQSPLQQSPIQQAPVQQAPAPKITPLSASVAVKKADSGNAFDDAHHDYIVHRGELFYGRYVLGAVLGQGSFGKVVKVFDTVRESYMALKIIRSGSPYYEQALGEVRMTNFLKSNSMVRQSNVVRVYDTFIHRGHLCLVFELLSFSLYDLLRSTNFSGVSLKLVQQFARQLLTCLEFLNQNGVDVIHSDIKPENVLLQHSQVILGCMPYDSAIDMWSLGCMLVELHVGVALFAGQNEGDQMSLIVEKLGIPPEAMLDNGKKTKRFFHTDEQNGWQLNAGLASREEDVAPGSIPLRQFVNESLKRGNEDVRRQSSPGELELFFDLVEQLLTYDPRDRLEPSAALQHPFFSFGKGDKGTRDHSPPPVVGITTDISSAAGDQRSKRESGRDAPNKRQLVATGLLVDEATQTKAAHGDRASYNQEAESWKEELGIQSPAWRNALLAADPRREMRLIDDIRASIFLPKHLSMQANQARNLVGKGRFGAPPRFRRQGTRQKHMTGNGHGAVLPKGLV